MTAPSGSLREATAEYLARLDREIEAAQQAVRAAGQDPDAQRAAKAYLDGRLREWDRAVAWVRSVNDAALAVLAVSGDQP